MGANMTVCVGEGKQGSLGCKAQDFYYPEKLLTF